jgi:hypothetical protein
MKAQKRLFIKNIKTMKLIAAIFGQDNKSTKTKKEVLSISSLMAIKGGDDNTTGLET